MHKLIGGEFQIDNSLLIDRGEYSTNLKLSSGRSALFSILYSINKGTPGKILLPNYLCDSITRTVIDAGWEYEFYDINSDFDFDIDYIINKECSAVLIINYFGLLKLDKKIKQIKKTKENLTVIEDDVQAFFDYRNSVADYSFTSLRKWFPCPDGALINTKDKIESTILVQSKWSQYKFAGNYLKNQDKWIDDSICLELLKTGERLLDSEYMSPCSDVSNVIYSNIDFENLVKRRKKNAALLHKDLSKLNIKHFYSKEAIPLFIPIFVDNRNELRDALFKNNIFVPIHWPNINDRLNGTNILYSSELSLICDQRYDLEDMEKQINIIQRFIEGERRY